MLANSSQRQLIAITGHSPCSFRKSENSQRFHQGGTTWAKAGKPAEAAALLEKAIRLTPTYYPAWWLSTLGRAHRLAGHYDEAIAALESAKDHFGQNVDMHVALAVTYVEVGRDAEARAEAETILKLDPSFSIAEFAKALPYRDPEDLDRVVQAMRQAGLPE